MVLLNEIAVPKIKIKVNPSQYFNKGAFLSNAMLLGILRSVVDIIITPKRDARLIEIFPTSKRGISDEKSKIGRRIKKRKNPHLKLIWRIINAKKVKNKRLVSKNDRFKKGNITTKSVTKNIINVAPIWSF
ncbi:hypothetical protein HOB25_00570 [bacterium]|nr:hypothetical protein [bacterium]